MISAAIFSIVVNLSAIQTTTAQIPTPESNAYAAAVPEPSVAALSLMSVAALAVRRRRAAAVQG